MAIRGKIVLPIILALISVQIAAAEIIEQRPVGPGVIFYHDYKSNGPWHIQVLEVDLRNPWIKLETAKARDVLAGNETTSSMALRNDREGHRVIGAINGDFYDSRGVPIGTQVLNGLILKNPASRSVFGISATQKPFFDIVSFQGQVIAPNTRTMPISGINEIRDTDDLVVFNRYYGPSTGTNFWGTEIAAKFLHEQMVVGDTVQLVAIAKDSLLEPGHGNNPIPADGLVLSGHLIARFYLDHNIFVGDTFAIVMQLPPILERLEQMIGGTPRLIRDGAISVEWEQEHVAGTFTYNRHPRTAIGCNSDSTKLYLFTVDGRRPGYSVGMSLFELAEYMLQWGVYQGINLDGGGSTTMVVRNQLVNRPSDAGGERAVSNALLVISTAPTGPLAQLDIAPAMAYVPAGKSLQFEVRGFDQYYNPVSFSVDSSQWQCSPQLGRIDHRGLFVAGQNQDSGYVYVSVGAIRDSSQVFVIQVASIELLPNPLILKIGESQALVPNAKDAKGHLVLLEPSDYQWAVNGDIGTISPNGVFRATQQGQGEVIASYSGVIGTAKVFVGIASEAMIDDFKSLANWSLSGTRVNLSQCQMELDNQLFLSAPSACRLRYSLATGGTSALYLNCSIPIAGSPEEIEIQVCGDGSGHWLRGEFEDADGEKFLVNFTQASPGINWSRSWKSLRVPLSEAILHWNNPNAKLTFPITWKRIYLAETDENKKNAGVIYLDDFKAHYIKTGVQNDRETSRPKGYKLHQNFPNPFNPITRISFELPKDSDVKLEVFNARGEKVANLVDGRFPAGAHDVAFDAKHLSTGIYWYRMEADNFRMTRKMVVLK
ncbi:MAG: phosphodiester glycosidase family protein [candidate division KSB1 bacterium]|nr:phosphodiester glycosidase family protein [candidate division KSB1 bacterium]MDZ7335787.1 phosphodiester glycosidase family protein [candidate division KSB1 bacterium]MDZ7359094.1 phosphodiester glycosidase family protein [candidate division KSB1 bacterium]MDZ7400774.1 phosphodiester glycosidase family protein [candidate division KSB1 bacterium]